LSICSKSGGSALNGNGQFCNFRINDFHFFFFKSETVVLLSLLPKLKVFRLKRMGLNAAEQFTNKLADVIEDGEQDE
jgi:hypothetical protein